MKRTSSNLPLDSLIRCVTLVCWLMNGNNTSKKWKSFHFYSFLDLLIKELTEVHKICKLIIICIQLFLILHFCFLYADLLLRFFYWIRAPWGKISLHNFARVSPKDNLKKKMSKKKKLPKRWLASLQGLLNPVHCVSCALEFSIHDKCVLSTASNHPQKNN